MNKLILCFISVILCTHLNAGSLFAGHQEEVRTVQERFDADWARQDMTYYIFGLMAKPMDETALKAMKEKYGLSVVIAGCLVSDDLLQYNKLVNKKFAEEYGKTVHELLAFYENGAPKK